jgi:hypothetical protein
MQDQKQAVQKEATFVKLDDLQMEDVTKGLKDGSFVKLPVVFKQTFGKKGSELVSINIELHKQQLQQLRLNNGGTYIPSAKFHGILIATDSKYEDEKGNSINTWHKQALCRFVKGSYTNREGEYYSLEVIFKQGQYIIHFFSYDEIQTILLLESKKIKSFNWITRPDKIDFVEPTEQFSF